jgi:hypothetical protein
MGLPHGGSSELRLSPWWLRAFLLVNVVQDFGLGLSGLLFPEHFLIPLKGLTPLNARFVGSLYLAGGVVILCAALMRRVVDARIPLWSFFVITVFVLGMTFAYWRDFTVGGVPKLWMLTYVVDPIVVPIAIVTLGLVRPAEPGRHRLTAIFLTQAAVLGGVGLALLIASDAVLAAWPWAISRLLARVYAAFFLAFAVGALLAAYERRARAVQAFLAGSAALLVFTLTTTLLHLDRFASGPALALWVAVHLAGLAAFGYGLATSLRGSESLPRLSASAP